MAVDDNPGSPPDTTQQRDAERPEHAGHPKNTRHSRPLGRPAKKKRRLLGWIFSLASIILLTWITITLISGRGSGFSDLAGLFNLGGSSEPASEYHFTVGSNRVFANLEGSIASAGTLGVQVLSANGTETLRDVFHMSSPAIETTEGRAIAFDIGGSAVRTFSKTQVSATIETGGAIISASINKNNWFVVCTQESEAFRSVVTAYDNRGRDVYRISLATGYALSAMLTPDNKKLAVLDLTNNGSRITIYDLSREEPDGVFEYPDGLILDMQYTTGGKILAVAADSLIIVDAGGAGTELFGFDGRRLGGYVFGDNFTALHLFDYSVGYSGRLITLDDTGRLLGGVVTDKELLSMSASRGYLTILKNEGPVFFDSELNEYLTVGELAVAAGATRVLSLSDDAALVASDHFAVVLKIGRAQSSDDSRN